MGNHQECAVARGAGLQHLPSAMRQASYLNALRLRYFNLFISLSPLLARQLSRTKLRAIMSSFMQGADDHAIQSGVIHERLLSYLQCVLPHEDYLQELLRFEHEVQRMMMPAMLLKNTLRQQFSVIKTTFNLVEQWQAIQAGSAAPDAVILSQPTYWVLLKEQATLCIRAMSSDLFRFATQKQCLLGHNAVDKQIALHAEFEQLITPSKVN